MVLVELVEGLAELMVLAGLIRGCLPLELGGDTLLRFRVIVVE